MRNNYHPIRLLMLLLTLLAACGSFPQVGSVSLSHPVALGQSAAEQLPIVTLAPIAPTTTEPPPVTELPTTPPAPLFPTFTPIPTFTAAPSVVPIPSDTPTALVVPTETPWVVPTPTPDLLPSPEPTSPTTATIVTLPESVVPFTAALRPAFVNDLANYADMPRYQLSFWLYPDTGVLTGTEQIIFPNRTGMPLADIALRLPPNFPYDDLGDGGDIWMEVTASSVAGQPVLGQSAAQGTALLLPLAQPLAPGEETVLDLSFKATMTPWEDGSWPLPSSYPMLAVREGANWRLDVTTFPDQIFSERALYGVMVNAPSNLMVTTSGSIVDVQSQSDGRTTYRAYAGPMRDFVITMGDFDVVHTVAGEVAVNVYSARGSGFDIQQIARISADSLLVFERRFGAYPYRELDVQLIPESYDGGDEYPSLIFVYTNGQVDEGTHYVTAHEVAHQWWYGIIGNDIFREAWLDEAFAQYSGIVYAEDAQGAALAASFWEREVMERYRDALADGDLPIGWAIEAYPSFDTYYCAVYGKGAVFLRTLREQLGDAVFFAALQHYYQNHRYGVATTADVQRAFEEASGQNLSALFRAWVTGE